MITIKGNLIALEPLDIEKHARGYFAVSQDENIHKYTGNSVPQNVDEIVLLLMKYENYFLNWMITSNDTHEVIGIIRLGKPKIENGVLVAGESQFLSSKYWRKGHMKEAKRLFYQYVFEVLSVDILYADVWEGNINSMKSLESYGYRLVDTTDEIFSKTGELKKKFIYALSRDSYRRHIDDARLGQ
ncbi:MAG: GNAT family N-acetyltransferase [Oscillospiraceae bacterium]|nr:GNAT family N-acetyltransferase [Oscillospiraceae bacterium]